jgi:hypothetical protein
MGFEGDQILPFKPYLAHVWLKEACDDIEQRCLPGAVGTDDSQDLTFFQFKGDPMYGLQATKILAHTFQFQERQAETLPRSMSC